jgi:hypothetical protein
MGSAPTSAEMVISWAAPASNSAARRHGRLGGAEETTVAESGPRHPDEPTGGALLMVIENPTSTSPEITNIADQASRRT